jgi:hypothetical protein
MGQAALTFLGVILGAAIAGGVSLWQVQLITKREREARQEFREQERRDRRDTFQRETLLAVQDAVTDLWKATIAIYDRSVGETRGGGSWPQRPDPVALPNEWIEVDGRLGVLAARVFDSQLSTLLIDLRTQSLRAVTAAAQDEAFKKVGEQGSLTWKVNGRIGDLLPELF